MIDKYMMLNAVDIVRTISEHNKGFKKVMGKILNRINYLYYKLL